MSYIFNTESGIMFAKRIVIFTFKEPESLSIIIVIKIIIAEFRFRDFLCIVQVHKPDVKIIVHVNYMKKSKEFQTLNVNETLL